MLKLGSVSKQVAAWQTFLGLPADGIFGEGTEAATKDFQIVKGLKPVDGIVGTETYRAAAAAGFSVPSSAAGYYPPRPRFGSPSDLERKRLFGSFGWKAINASEILITGNWREENIVRVKIPQLVGVYGAPPDGVIQFHKAGVDQLKGFFAEVERQGLKHLIISWAGSFYPRFIRGSRTELSNHSWGTAFDINAAENWLGQTPAAEGKKGSLLRLVPIANSFGFFWGGHYNGRLDGMHFELAVLGMFPKTSAKPFLQPASSLTGLNLIDAPVVLEVPPPSDAPDDSASAAQPAPQTQTADQITNIQAAPAAASGEALPENFKPENLKQNAPAPEGSTAQATKATVLGFAVPASVLAVLRGLEDYATKGFIDVKEISGLLISFILEKWIYLFWLILALIAFLAMKKAFKQLSFMLTLWINGKATMNNITIQPVAAAPPRKSFFPRIYEKLFRAKD